MMVLQYRTNYEEFSDKELVGKILAIPHNEEAAAYLLYERYDPLTRSIYVKLYKEITRNEKYVNMYWYDDCVAELFLHLRGKDGDWHPVQTFGWRCSLGSWLKCVSYKKFKKYLLCMIDTGGILVSIDTDDEDFDAPRLQLPDDGVEEFERRQQKVLLMEAIGLLEDADQKFVIIKRLEGYNSREIAVLLQKRWQKHGIKKYNNKKELVVPDAAYVDVRTQRAKENLKKIIVNLK